MFYFREGWWLFKKTGWASVRLILIAAVPMLLYAGGVALAAGSGGVLFGLCAFLGFMLWLAVLPAVSYTHFVVVSAPFFGEEPIRVWPLVKRGFSVWGRMVRLMLAGLLIGLPLTAVFFVIMFGLSGGFPPTGTPRPLPLWVSLLFTLTTFLLGAYGQFAGLNVVRDGRRTWEAWGKAFRLLPGQEWLRTLGVLVGVHLGTYLMSLAAGLALGMPDTPQNPGDLVKFGAFGLVSGLIGSALAWYLALCQVSIWHRYHEGGGSTSAGPPLPADEPMATA